MRKILVDSNFLFLPINRGINIFNEVERLLNSKVEFIVLTSVFDEIKKIISKTKKIKIRKDAIFALSLSKKLKKMDFKDGKTVDDCLVEAALKHGFIVATSDMKLRKKLRSLGVPVIYPRKDGKYLVLEGYVD